MPDIRDATGGCAVIERTAGAVEDRVDGAIRPGVGRLFLFSLGLGIRGVSTSHLKDWAARIVNPISYPRAAEYEMVFDALDLRPGQRVLDIGSPKLPTWYLAARADVEVHATDIRDYFIPGGLHLLRRAGAGRRIGRDVFLLTQDARRLTYPDAYFQRIYSISVIEHIPGDGDSAACRETARALAPGGRFVITVPYRAEGYREEFVEEDVYERARRGRERVFYQRRYDDAAIRERLVTPSGLELESVRYFGEPNVAFEERWNAVPAAVRLPVLWTAPFLAKAFLRELSPAERSRACGACVTFRKPIAGAGREAA